MYMGGTVLFFMEYALRNGYGTLVRQSGGINERNNKLRN